MIFPLLILSLTAFAVNLACAHDDVIIRIARRDTNNTVVPAGSPSDNATTYSIVLTGFEECNSNSFAYGTNVNWRNWIIGGFKEHDTMSMRTVRDENGGIIEAYPSVDWLSAAAIEFFGPGYKNGDYRNAIQYNLDQHANMDYAWFLGWRLHVRCDDPLGDCLNKATRQPKKVATEAYTIHGEDDQCSPLNNHINFCPNYFNLPTLDNAMSAASGAAESRNGIRTYWNRASTWAHETMHITWLANPIATGEGWMRDIVIYGASHTWSAYRTLDVKYLSYSEGVPPTSPYNNPQNYAYYMLANYIQSEFDWYPSQNVWLTSDDPPQPPNLPTLTYNSSSVESNGTVLACTAAAQSISTASATASSSGNSTASSTSTSFSNDPSTSATVQSNSTTLATSASTLSTSVLSSTTA